MRGYTVERLPVCGVILAGGQSRRMGQNKALLPLNGETLVARQARKFQAWFQETVVVTNEPDLYRDLGLPLVADLHPGCGPLAGVEAGLAAAHLPWAFVAAVDLPFLERSLITQLWTERGAVRAVVPRPQGRWQPTSALYHQDCLAPAGELLEQGFRRVEALFERVPVAAVEVAQADRLFFNANTPEDWAWVLTTEK